MVFKVFMAERTSVTSPESPVNTVANTTKPALSKKQRRTARAWAAVRDVAATFPLLWPDAKSRRYRAVKIGIGADVSAWIASHPECGLSEETWKKAIRFLVSRIEYLRTVTEGAERADLNGEVVGAVTKSEARHAREKIVALRVRLAALKKPVSGEQRESVRESGDANR